MEPGHCGVMVRCDGPVTGRELIEANEAIAVCHHPRYQLWDFSNATSVSALADDIHQLALQDSAIPDTANLTAILIVGSRESVVKLVHAYELFSSGWVGRRCHYQTKLFGTLNDAQSWLKAELGITDFE